jgi:uncharacterized protein involved in exopolysaccharide biosynthesis
MAQPISTPQEFPAALGPSRTASVIVAGGSGLGLALLLAALALWFHYGTAVFFETIVSGLTACF